MPVLDEVLEQLERDPDARFVLDGQTVLLEDYLAIRPEQAARCAALIRRGALEVGPWYVQADLLLPSAASLRANLEAGARDAAAWGQRLAVLYSADAFGQPAELPALAAEFGIRYAVIRRGLGRPGHLDRDLYHWESAAGDRLLVYHLPAGGYDVAIDLTRPGAELAACWAPIRRELVERAVTPEIAVFLGADHHAMARDLAGLRARMQALEPGNLVRVSGLAEFFAAVERAEPNPRRLHGELRRGGEHSWILQGVHATRARLKREHGEAELLLARIAEPLARLAAAAGGLERSGLLRAAWRTLLQCQFHDTLAGTTSDPVQREQQVRLEAVRAFCREIATDSLGELVGRDPHGRPDSRLVLWNPSPRPRKGILTAELSFFRADVLVGAPDGRKPRTGAGYAPFALEAPSGALIPVQRLAARPAAERRDAMRRYPDQDLVERVWVAFRAPALGGGAVATLTPRATPLTPMDEGVSARPRALANRFVAVGIGPTGVLSLTDQRTGEEYRGLGELVDEPDRGDLYTFSRGPGRAASRGVARAQRVLAGGPLVAAVETCWTQPSAGRGWIGARQVVALRADSPLVRVRLELDNQAVDHRLRARFPVGAGAVAVAGSGLGAERRPPVPAGRPGGIEQEVATAPAQRFVAAGAGGRGLALLTPGFFEYEWTAGQELLVTLLRSVGELSRGELPERPGHAAWPLPTPEAQELGLHRIDVALVPLSEAADPARLEEWWEDAFCGVQACWFRGDP